jgi:hypothetical protein
VRIGIIGAERIGSTLGKLRPQCCPFLRFTLDMPEDGGPLRLRVWGAPGVKAFVAAEMNVKTS